MCCNIFDDRNWSQGGEESRGGWGDIAVYVLAWIEYLGRGVLNSWMSDKGELAEKKVAVVKVTKQLMGIWVGSFQNVEEEMTHVNMWGKSREKKGGLWAEAAAFLRANDSFQTEINWLKFDNEQVGLAKRLQEALLSGDQKKLSFDMEGSCPGEQRGSAAIFVKMNLIFAAFGPRVSWVALICGSACSVSKPSFFFSFLFFF